jgi:hypothetical protein
MSARLIRTLGLVACVLGLVAVAPAASAGHKTDPHTKNLHPLGPNQEHRSLINPRVGNTNIHTDIAFWAKLAFQGNWDGFTIRDLAAPGNPTTISPTSCDGTQGDIVVWESILVRSWTRPPAHPGRSGRA